MASLLGKRKRSKAAVVQQARESSTSSAVDSEEENAQAIFKRHFEAHFKPLPEPVKKVTVAVDERSDEESDEDDEDEWSGIDDEGANGVEVVEHTIEIPKSVMSKAELRKFMSSKPPTDIDAIFDAPRTAIAKDKGDDPSESSNLKNDLALQRLLSESHLLDSSSTPILSGSNRHKATDLRLRSLGAKTSILAQKNMPVAMRRGIEEKKRSTEEKRRKQAKENGIILEVATGSGKGKDGPRMGGMKSNKEEGRRERGIGVPAVGRFSGGTLTLSKKDVFAIEGPKKMSGKGGRGRGGGRGGGRGRGRGGKKSNGF